MAEHDLFDLTGLPFDSSVRTTTKIIREAIEKRRKEINTELGAGGTQQIRRDALNSMLKDLSKYEREIFSDTDDPLKKYKSYAQVREKKALNELKATIAMIVAVGTRMVTNSTVNAQKQISGLSKDTIIKAFTNAGIDIKQTKKLKEIWKSIQHNERIFYTITALQKEKPLDGTDLSIITDLYSLAAFLCDKVENTILYREKTTPELAKIFDTLSIKYAGGSSSKIADFYKDIVSAGKTYVFKSDENRKEYDNYLLYQAPKLTELYKILKNTPAQNKTDPKYAEMCIKTISEVLGDYDIALAIYNKEADIENDPYEPVRVVFYVKCAKCQNLSEFDSEVDAKSKNKCMHCGKPLYKPCNKCHKNVLASLDKCPECGFVFASTAMFAKFFAAAEQALRRSDFEEARNNLFQAQTADPSEKTRTAQLEARILAEEKRCEKPVTDLRKLIADRKYQKASEALATTIASFPDLNVTAFESQINSALMSAKNVFAAAKKLPTSKQADSCLEILHEYVDFKPAIDFLRATQPEPCKSFSIGLDSIACNANVSWARSSEQGITYRIVRKQGNDIPTNEMDGEILLDNTTDTSFKDKSVQPGRYYSYAAFAIRYGVFSTTVGKTIVILADVTDAHCEQISTTIRITWSNPQNCTGVTIKRTAEGVTTTLTNNANRSFDDKGIKYGIAYSYKLCANYSGLSPSYGVDVVITPMVKIDSFSIKAEQIKDNTYRLAWDINRNGIDLKILVNEKQVREIKSDVGFCDVNLPPDGFYTITIIAYSGGAWLRSLNSPQINTYAPCTIDKPASQLHEDAIVGSQNSAYSISLHLKVSSPIPNNVIGFYYAVRTKSSLNEKAPWADRQEIETAHDIQRVNLPAYQKTEKIVYTNTANEESSYYISLFTIYNFGGQKIISNASKCRYDRPLTADLYWRINKSLLGGLKLTIDISANRPFERIPELVLCACSDGQHLLSINDPKGRRIKSFSELIASTAQLTYTNTYELGAEITAKQMVGLKLFLFEAAPVLNENFTLRWIKGFNGKIQNTVKLIGLVLYSMTAICLVLAICLALTAKPPSFKNEPELSGTMLSIMGQSYFVHTNHTISEYENSAIALLNVLSYPDNNIKVGIVGDKENGQVRHGKNLSGNTIIYGEITITNKELNGIHQMMYLLERRIGEGQELEFVEVFIKNESLRFNKDNKPMFYRLFSFDFIPPYEYIVSIYLDGYYLDSKLLYT
jgi:predicted RNA-binding Zn-ribbon protein involved in translation (DUF1610 family)